MGFHASAKREEEKKPVEVSKGGLFGTGVNEWYALPIGIAAAVPAIKFDWYIINEETQLLSAFIAFCVVVYTQGGDAIYNALDERAKTLLKEHRESEQEVIEEMEELVKHFDNQMEIPEIMEELSKVRAETYDKLNAAGKIKPKHDLKAQVERILTMLASEETSNKEKAKHALMAEATASVSEQFASDKAMKKAALDAAIATIKGGTKSGSDPVKDAFVNFFKEKGAAAKKSKDDSEDKAQRAAFLAKANAVAESEGYFFRFNPDGTVKMAA
jgi:hypothetical protein